MKFLQSWSSTRKYVTCCRARPKHMQDSFSLSDTSRTQVIFQNTTLLQIHLSCAWGPCQKAAAENSATKVLAPFGTTEVGSGADSGSAFTSALSNSAPKNKKNLHLYIPHLTLPFSFTIFLSPSFRSSLSFFCKASLSRRFLGRFPDPTVFFEHAREIAEAAYVLNPLDAENLTRWGGALLELSQFQTVPDSKKMPLGCSIGIMHGMRCSVFVTVVHGMQVGKFEILRKWGELIIVLI
ncbi:uncharacterized protein LOC119986849 [Tripterygium wilfordii]|uniref:uncharacterized protein LOC119986849 n=1 Tax=Tripterygium wilfordii TaxID=458696 RepID=UPI0018F8527A|nr:uncharacterized protein LOC119986849 [Tripterygium wilfordii]